MARDEIAAGWLVQILAGYAPTTRTVFAVYPSGRFVPAKAGAFTHIITTELENLASA